VVNELKINGKAKPERFDEVTVYFSDVVGFTNMSTNLDPEFLIDELNEIFTSFDDIMIKHHCERIKTIGDAYMAVCGLPEKDDNHAFNILSASKEIIQFLDNRNENSELKWRIRIGVNSGKVVGGIVGIRKYIYDIFGDSVNTASRMESNSEPMRINVSESTMVLAKNHFHFTERDEIEVKGKGKMKMYFLEN
jgi:adenylate cyclase